MSRPCNRCHKPTENTMRYCHACWAKIKEERKLQPPRPAWERGEFSLKRCNRDNV